MANGDVGFLDALRVIGRDIEEKVEFGSKVAAGLSGEGDEVGLSCAAGLHAVEDVGALAAGGEGDQDIVGGDEGFDLTGKDMLEAESLPAAVRTEGLVERARAGRPGGRCAGGTTSSAARWMASAALPPLPKKTILPPERRDVAADFSVNWLMRAMSSSEKDCLTRTLSASWRRISSADMSFD